MTLSTRYRTRIWQAALWLFAGVFLLSASPAIAQQSGSLLANSSPDVEERNANISLQEALTRVSNLHGVSFLYRPEEITGKVVHRKKALPAQLEGQLHRILTPHGLTSKQVGEKSYAIVPQTPTAARGVPASIDAIAQTGIIQGTVTDNTGPLPGVQVVIQGTTRGDVTSPDGTYEISGSRRANTPFRPSSSATRRRRRRSPSKRMKR